MVFKFQKVYSIEQHFWLLALGFSFPAGIVLFTLLVPLAKENISRVDFVP